MINYIKYLRTKKDLNKYSGALKPVLSNIEKNYEVKGNYLISKFLEGGTLQSFIEDGILNEITKTDIIKSIIFELKKIHNQNLIHRDLTPNNIIINGKNASIIDFDTACYNEGEHTLNIGTPSYTAPEVKKTTKYDQSIDIYSLGMIIYFMEGGIVPNEIPKEDKEWFEEAKISDNVSLWFRPTTSIYIKEIILRCANINPKSRPSLDELSNINIFPSRSFQRSYHIDTDDVDSAFAKYLYNDLRSSLDITCSNDIAFDSNELEAIRFKLALNGYPTYCDDLFNRDDDEINFKLALYCGGYYDANLAYFNLIAYDLNTTCYYCFLNLDSAVSRAFIENYLPENVLANSVDFPYIFSDVDEFMMDLNKPFSFYMNLLTGDKVAKNQIAAAYYSLKWIGISKIANEYVLMDDGDRDEVLHRLLDFKSDTLFFGCQTIGYMLTNKCPHAFSLTDLLRIVFEKHLYETYAGLGIIFLAYALWGDYDYGKKFVDYLDKKINYEPLEATINSMTVMPYQLGPHQLVPLYISKNPTIVQIFKEFPISVILYKYGDNIVGMGHELSKKVIYLNGKEEIPISQCEEITYVSEGVAQALCDINTQKKHTNFPMVDEFLIVSAYQGWVFDRTTFSLGV